MVVVSTVGVFLSSPPGVLVAAALLAASTAIAGDSLSQLQIWFWCGKLGRFG